MNSNQFTLVITTCLILNIIAVKTTHSWKYQTKCTKVSKNSIIHNTNNEFQTDVASSDSASYSIVDDFEHTNTNENDLTSKMQLKCPNSNDFLFIGLTQYGVSSTKNSLRNDSCSMNENDCLVTVDYLADECNGLNSCNIQLDSQFLHTCRNLSDYLSVAYECIPGSKRVDICSNDETFIVDSNNLNTRFGYFYLTSPNYPNEYSSNLNNCSCKLEYVNIDDNTASQQQKEKNNKKQSKMNLLFKTYEFDLEEGESLISNEMMTNSKCTKDMLSLNSYETNRNLINPTQQLNLCGQRKEFEEFYMNGDLIRLNLTTDDAITRRGFLIEIQPTQETLCPYGTDRFNSKKCIKYFSESQLDWFGAVDACKSKSGRLLELNDFVDNLKLNNILRTKSIETQFWSHYKSNEIIKHNKCMSKNLLNWQNESCSKKLNYICEFDSIKLNTQSNDNTNRLIKVSCGSLSTIYSASTSPTTPIYETTRLNKRKQSPVKSIISWSSLIDKNTLQKKPKLSNEITSLFTTSTKTISNDYSDEQYQIESDLKQEKLITTNDVKNTTSINSQPSLISQELALIIAVICGVSIVFIIVNIFCIWNYYNRKFRAYIEKSETNTESNYRTSTLISRNGKCNTNSNNRSMSTVDSYVKMLPTYETCINVPTYLQSTHTANSSPNSTACLLNNTNEQKLELIKNFFQKQQSDQQHYYETLSLNKNNNNYDQHHFDSMVVLPVNSLTSAQLPASATSNSHVVLLNNSTLRQLQTNCVFNDLIATTSIPSPATNCQTKPLITFLNTSVNTNNINTCNNNNVVSDNTTSTSCSSSSSPAPAEL